MDQEKDHKHGLGQVDSDEDATLDIIRLLVETESRLASTQARETGDASYLTDGDVKSAARPSSGAAPEDLSEPEPEIEDLRPQGIFAARAAKPKSKKKAKRSSRRLRMPRLLPRLKLPLITLPTALSFKKAPPEELLEPLGSESKAAEKTDWKQNAKLAGLVSLALVVLFKPWLIPLVIFGLVWFGLIIFLLMGSANVSDVVADIWSYYRAKRPEKAGRVLTALQNAADRLDGILARLPARWVDGIYTPDLGRSERDMSIAEAYDLKDDPFDRLLDQATAAE